jgi:ankyrin repeat protein
MKCKWRRLFLTSIFTLWAAFSKAAWANGNEGTYPLHRAIETKDLPSALKLIQGRRHNQELRKGISPFSLAVSLQFIDIVKAIVESEKDRKDDFLNSEFATYFQQKLWSNKKFDFLKAYGFRPEFQNKEGLSVFMLAIKDKVRSYLPSCGLGSPIGPTQLNLSDKDGNTAFHHLMLGLSIKSSKEISAWDKEFLTALLNCGIKVDSRNKNGQTPLQIAYSKISGQASNTDIVHVSQIITLLLEHGADPNSLENQGRNLLFNQLSRLNLKPRIPEKKVLERMGQFYSEHPLEFRLVRSGGVHLSHFKGQTSKDPTSTGSSKKIDRQNNLKHSPISKGEAPHFSSISSMFYFLRKEIPLKSFNVEGRKVEFGYQQIWIDGKLYHDNLPDFAFFEVDARGEDEEPFDSTSCLAPCTPYLDEWGILKEYKPLSLVGNVLTLSWQSETRSPGEKPSFFTEVTSLDLNSLDPDFQAPSDTYKSSPEGSRTLESYFQSDSLTAALKRDSCIVKHSDPKELESAASWREVLNLKGKSCFDTGGNINMEDVINMKRTGFVGYDSTADSVSIRLYFPNSTNTKMQYLGLKVKPTEFLRERLQRVKAGEGFFIDPRKS